MVYLFIFLQTNSTTEQIRKIVPLLSCSPDPTTNFEILNFHKQFLRIKMAKNNRQTKQTNCCNWPKVNTYMHYSRSFENFVWGIFQIMLLRILLDSLDVILTNYLPLFNADFLFLNHGIELVGCSKTFCCNKKRIICFQLQHHL